MDPIGERIAKVETICAALVTGQTAIWTELQGLRTAIEATNLLAAEQRGRLHWAWVLLGSAVAGAIGYWAKTQ